MFKRPQTLFDVVALTFAISCCALLVSLPSSYLLFDLETPVFDLFIIAGITLVCSVPMTGLLGNELRKNEILKAALQETIDRDQLTGTATRTCFFRNMEEKTDALGVYLMIDIDRFKSINDTHGHLIGDEVLGHIGRALSRTVRSRDLVCRFGGEEFIVFLEDFQMEEGLVAAERIRRAIAAEVVPTARGPISVTVSIGVSFKEPTVASGRVIKLADDALYRAKGAGRNQTMVAAA